MGHEAEQRGILIPQKVLTDKRAARSQMLKFALQNPGTASLDTGELNQIELRKAAISLQSLLVSSYRRSRIIFPQQWTEEKVTNTEDEYYKLKIPEANTVWNYVVDGARYTLRRTKCTDHDLQIALGFETIQIGLGIDPFIKYFATIKDGFEIANLQNLSGEQKNTNPAWLLGHKLISRLPPLADPRGENIIQIPYSGYKFAA